MWTIPGDSKWIKTQNEHEPTRIYGEEIANFAKNFPDNAEVLEIGCTWAVSTIAMLATHPTMRLLSIDPILGEPNHSHDEVKRQGYEDRWSFEQTRSKQFWGKNLKEGKTWDVIYVDGSHLYADCMMDMNEGWRWLKPGGLLFVDDYVHKKNMDGEFGVALSVTRFLSEKYTKEIEKIECSAQFFAAWKRNDV